MSSKITGEKEELHAKNFKWTTQPSDGKTASLTCVFKDESSGEQCTKEAADNSDYCQDQRHWSQSGCAIPPLQKFTRTSSSSQPEASDLGLMVDNQLVIPNSLDLGALAVTTGNSVPVGGYSVLSNCANWSGSMTRQFLPCCSKTFSDCQTFASPSAGVDCAALVLDILFGTFS